MLKQNIVGQLIILENDVVIANNKNLITTAGDIFYTKKITGESTSIFDSPALKLGTNSQVPSKSDTDVISPVTAITPIFVDKKLIFGSSIAWYFYLLPQEDVNDVVEFAIVDNAENTTSALNRVVLDQPITLKSGLLYRFFFIHSVNEMKFPSSISTSDEGKIDIFGDNSVESAYFFNGNINDETQTYNLSQMSGTLQFSTDSHENQAIVLDKYTSFNNAYIPRPDKRSSTISFWFYLDPDWYQHQSINEGTVFATSNRNGYDLNITPYGLNAHNGYNRNTYKIETTISPDSLPIEQWTHACLVIDKENTTIKLYINGVLQVENTDWTGEVTSSTSDFNYIGYCGDSYYGEDYYKGKLDTIRVFNRALTDSEIKILLDPASIQKTLYLKEQLYKAFNL